MKKNDIKKAFSTLKNAQEKEQFLKDHNIKFTHDSFNKLIIWCSDGILEMSPIYKGGCY